MPIDVLANDGPGDPLVPLDATTVQLLTPRRGVPVTTLTVAGEGAYTVDPATGVVTFTPAGEFFGATTPITYTVADANGTIGQAVITIDVAANPAIDLAKTAAPYDDANSNGRVDAGETITYTFTVTNIGDVTLNPVAVTDALVGWNAEPCGTAPLAPGDPVECQVAFTIAQGDIGADLVNNAQAVGTPPAGAGGPVTDDASETVPLPAEPSIQLDKSAGAVTDVNGNGLEDVGDTIAYSFQVTNAGNVVLDPITITDAMLGLAAEPCGSGALDPDVPAVRALH